MATASTNQSTFESGRFPTWISGWGHDELSVFVEFSLSTGDRYWEFIDQRLRWIPAGDFVMGSPESEAGRFDREGPAHEVTLSRGFWMMDTPVTQELWEHVMGENPSRFFHPHRPVELVDWNACASFCEKLGTMLGGSFELPSEAQWEYACRAGNQAATYAGELQIRGERNGPVLDPIAWYGGNSGVDFDLEDGHDSSGWPEKQYEHQLAGTRIVGQKQPNDWGLFDMLGNVWEWCHDGKRRYTNEAVLDPMGSTDANADRVFRGGSWGDHAQGARAAYRSAYRPGYRDSYLGFRCVGVQP
ncbi:MAG: formylglycine-generating enzyme family protein [Planctomycetota bacterium]